MGDQLPVATRFRSNDDGTAWWVTTGNVHVVAGDRFELEVMCPNVYSWGDPCEGNVEIAQSEWRPCLLCDGSKGSPGTVLCQVAVVSVVPVEADSLDPFYARVVVRDDAKQVLVMPGRKRLSIPGEFPPAAPGDIAVLLNVTSTKPGRRVVD